MMRLASAIAVLAVALPGIGHAQRRVVRAPITESPQIGGHVGYNFDADHLFVGVQGSIPVGPQVDFYPSLDYYTIPHVTEWALNLDFKLLPPKAPSWYFGTGLTLFHAGGNKSHLNVFGGWQARTGGLRPYAEAREILFGGSSFQVAGGLNLLLH